ncbi:MAG TPA: bifunctional UDP-N-acetylglucosamine diphosphorylase/glucosamine-1-phosphate N-acetyltransferase GlmU [Limnochordia bacterium]|nr:bifunctional UDP-N-acetylglucosamine diphosphorylase/glucosamine-1-phosphate N-acetyltransferase GlmU [Bacillota bacterium]HKM17361.1 bifunctional UDP-N-acetylglucosamine diphosphorylase/glucosamine-1-phosphate N-acetyltransferase GlmU [Limnochordia bacterium]
MTASAIILAAGQGQRMKSELPKPLHKVCGVPMVKLAADSVRAAGIDRIYLVIGHGGEQVRQAVPGINYVVQAEQLGTGHAVDQCREMMAGVDGPVLVACADTPLFRAETFKDVLTFHQEQKAAAAVVTAVVGDPGGYGRVIRNEAGHVQQIVEERDALPPQKQIKEINTGTFCFDSRLLFQYLAEITPDNAQGEYYLTDVISGLVRDGHTVAAYALPDPEEALGVNDRIQLSQAEQLLRRRICHRHMLNGVTIINPEQTYVEPDCEIGNDTIIYPNTYIQKGTKIGANCLVGPNVRLEAAELADHVIIEQAVVLQGRIGGHTTVGPFAYIRPGTVIGSHCRIGDFVEVKNSQVADESKIPHLSYIGDAIVGSRVNIGCGTITCNYDGKQKHQTIIEDRCFIGSNSNLVAPVRLNKGAYVAAGSTVTEDVPEYSLAIARARQVNKEGWNKMEG